MAADSKMEKKGHNLTITWAVLLIKSRLRTSTHVEIIVYILRGCRSQSSRGCRTSLRSSIGSPLTTARALLVLSSSLVTVRRQKLCERGRSLFTVFFL